MTSIQPQPAPRSDDHAARTARRTGKASQNTASPDGGAEFSSLVAASQRMLEASRLAAMKGSGATENDAMKNFDDPGDDNGANASSPQGMPLAQDSAAQGQASQVATAAASASNAAQIGATEEDGSDWTTLGSLLPTGADDGLFEVLMPNQAKVGVAVSDHPDGLSYLLMPEDALLSDRLRSHEMELEALLRRRIRRNVKVVVL